MKLTEFDNYGLQSMPSAMYEPESDQVSAAHLDDTRKDKLTLKDLNRLKKLRAFRKLQKLKRNDTLAMMYSQPEGDDGGGDF